MEIAFKIRHDLISTFDYIRLTMSLFPADKGGGIFNPTVSEAIEATGVFINSSNEKQLISGGPAILNALDPIYQSLLNTFPPKKDLGIISKSFHELLEQDKSFLSYGIPFSWLDEHIDTSKVLNPETPYHARIGTGYHAGKFSLEEMYLMDDGFYFLVLAENSTKLLIDLIPENRRRGKDGYPDPDFYNEALYIKLNACSYARNSIVNLFSFVECLVNSIGYDYFLRNKSTLTDKEQELLQGKRNGSFISLEFKLEKFHQIIRPDKKQVFSVTDTKQIKEPFLTFLDECKHQRDAAMHYSPNKKDIWLKPTDWTEKAKKYSVTTLEVARQFWEACYPDLDFPFYLRHLDYQACYDGAVKRYNDSEQTKKNNSR